MRSNGDNGGAPAMLWSMFACGKMAAIWQLATADAGCVGVGVLFRQQVLL